MKSVSPALEAHLAQELTTLAELVTITRKDGALIALTSHDADLTVEGVTYKADGAFSALGKMTQNAALKTKDFDVEGLLDSELIAKEDIEAGLYDHARIDVALCNWADPSQGILPLRRGWLGEVVIHGGQYVASLRGLHDLLTRKVGETYTPECRFDLGDSRCKVNCAALTVTGTVSAVTDSRHFTDLLRTEEKGWFTGGKLTWLSGANTGSVGEVCAWDLTTQQFTLWLPTPFGISVGDSYSVVPGCDKRFATCRTRFNNGVNYGGFPHLPGLGKILQYPD